MKDCFAGEGNPIFQCLNENSGFLKSMPENSFAASQFITAYSRDLYTSKLSRLFENPVGLPNGSGIVTALIGLTEISKERLLVSTYFELPCRASSASIRPSPLLLQYKWYKICTHVHNERQGERDSLEIRVTENRKQVEIWLTNADQQDELLQKRLSSLYQDYHKKNYLIAVFRSGADELIQQTSALLCHNKKRLAELELRREQTNIAL